MKPYKVGVLTLVGSLSFWACDGPRETSHSGTPSGNRVSVVTEEITERSQVSEIEAVGTVVSRTVTTLSAKVLGNVTAVPVREGDRIQKDQLLVEIDDRDARARMEQAEASLEEARNALLEVEEAITASEAAKEATAAQAILAESTLERFRGLLERKSVSQQEFDEIAARHRTAQAQLRQAEQMVSSTSAKREQVKSRIRQAEAGLETARLNLSYCRVTAPFVGLISEKLVEEGQLASPGTPLLTLEDARHFEVEAIVPERHISRVSRGTSVKVRIDSLGQIMEGVVAEVVPRADPASRSFMVKVSLDPHPGLRTGLFAATRFPSASAKVLSLPESALVRRGQLVGVFVVDRDNRARFRLIQTGQSFGERIEVLSGLSSGDRIVVEPPIGIRDGSPVEISRSGVLPGADISTEPLLAVLELKLSLVV